jgi:hypothetical protein
MTYNAAIEWCQTLIRELKETTMGLTALTLAFLLAPSNAFHEASTSHVTQGKRIRRVAFVLVMSCQSYG